MSQATTLTVEEILKESDKALRFLEQFFDSRGYENTPYAYQYVVGVLVRHSPEEAWVMIKERINEVFQFLASQGLDWTDPHIAEVFEEEQRNLLVFDNKVLIKG